tara:strand:+ start:2978 stop:3475 length:498 start_codon:yes stop_codon:yes gene_type:complete
MRLKNIFIIMEEYNNSKLIRNSILPPIHEDNEYNEFMFMHNNVSDLRNKIKRLNNENDKLLNDNLIITNNVTKYRKKLDDKVLKYDVIIKKLKKENNDLKDEIKNLRHNNSDDMSCVICLDNKRNVLFKPCNHICICDTCSGSSDLKNCILCNAELTSYEYAYLN